MVNKESVLELLISCAKLNADASGETEDEVVDLKGLLRVIWPLLANDKKLQVLRSPAVKSLVKDMDGEYEMLASVEGLSSEVWEPVQAALGLQGQPLSDEEKVDLVNMHRIERFVHASVAWMNYQNEGRYIHGCVDLPFDGSDKVEHRLVYDQHVSAIVALEFRPQSGTSDFIRASNSQVVQVQSALTNGTLYILQEPEDFGLERGDELPAWAASWADQEGTHIDAPRG